MHTLNFLHRLFHSIFSMRMVAGFVLVSWNSMKFNEFLWRRDTSNGRSQGPLVWDFVENPIISWDTIKQMRRDTCWELGLLWLLNKETVMHCFIPFPFKWVKSPDSTDLPASKWQNCQCKVLLDCSRLDLCLLCHIPMWPHTNSAHKCKQAHPHRNTDTQ